MLRAQAGQGSHQPVARLEQHEVCSPRAGVAEFARRCMLRLSRQGSQAGAAGLWGEGQIKSSLAALLLVQLGGQLPHAVKAAKAV